MKQLVKQNAEGRIVELDVLRGLAAIIVFAFHCTLILPRTQGTLFKFGVTGVDLFFMISGFVILLTLDKTKYWKEFAIGRLVKLFPAYWVCVSFTATLILFRNIYLSISTPNLLKNFLGNLTMFQRYLGMPNLDEQYWTLEVEILFYAFMLVIFLVRGLGSIEIIGYAILVFIGIYDILFEHYFQISQYFILFNHFPLFFAGILFFKIKTEKGNYIHYTGLGCCFIVACMLFNNGGRSMYYVPFLEYVFMLSIYFILFFLLINKHLTFLLQKPLIFMGRISYGFYLVHQYISTKIVIPGLQKYFAFNFYLAVISAFCVSLFLAFLVTFFVEEPCFQRWKRYANKAHSSVDKLE